MLTQAIPATDLVEIFSSLQGEGTLVGYRQIFIRFPDCNLSCRYCDTDFEKKDVCLIESAPGSGVLEKVPNPVPHVTVSNLVNSWCNALPGAHHSISITGGEPLLHHEALAVLLPVLRKRLPIYLETNGSLVAELDSLIDHIDWVAMDIKLHSQTGARTEWDVHRDFLKIACRRPCYVKLVVGEGTTDLELQLTADLVAGFGSSIPIVLQPVTLDGRIDVSIERLMQMHAVIADIYADVRVVPQTHRFLGAL